MQHPVNTVNITIRGDLTITVPDNLGLMTPFVLMEQKDWFEDEISFVRSYIKPGMKVVDIGANYGLYTLTIAKLLGKTGALWAFEPTRHTHDCLRASLTENALNNVTLVRAGLSNRSGEAELFISPNSELNSLKADTAGQQLTESIKLTTLDQSLSKYAWDKLDFIKLDAEGEENNILEVGQETLSRLSPLVMFELKHGDTVNLTLIQAFNSLGYQCYKLVTGLNTLVPFDQTLPFDSYLLNLFCCKPDRARTLENTGHLVSSTASGLHADPDIVRTFISGLPFGNGLIASEDGDSDYMSMLASYLLSISDSEPIDRRVAHLFLALSTVRKMLLEGERRMEYLATFARIAFDAGERQLGVQILSAIIQANRTGIKTSIRELLLPPSARYDHLSPDGRINDWLYSAVLETFILKHSYSTYFSRQACLPYFDELEKLGFTSQDMKQRHNLALRCFSSPSINSETRHT